MVRDFPQRWTTCIEDLFGNLWSETPQMGIKICLEILKNVAEDCTDSDFNAKVSSNMICHKDSINQKKQSLLTYHSTDFYQTTK